MMTEFHPQYIKDTAGENLVVFLQHEFDALMEQLEELEDLRLYNEAKNNDNGERIAAEGVFKMIEANRGTV